MNTIKVLTSSQGDRGPHPANYFQCSTKTDPYLQRKGRRLMEDNCSAYNATEHKQIPFTSPSERQPL
ncbi:hypothetical protein FHG87_025689 [Trinorchestia longiramus]|nr:hypothetical protein FHG87_025689 [Trinorchestia longiramus]